MHQLQIQMSDIAEQIKSHQAEIEKLKKQQSDLSVLFFKERSDLAKQIKWEFKFEAKPVAKFNDFQRTLEDVVSFTVTATPTGEAADKYRELFGQMPKFYQDRDTVYSVTYFRKNGVIGHCGGGHLVLEDFTLCTEEEWEQLKAGNVDCKFWSPQMLSGFAYSPGF